MQRNRPFVHEMPWHYREQYPERVRVVRWQTLWAIWRARVWGAWRWFVTPIGGRRP